MPLITSNLTILCNFRFYTLISEIKALSSTLSSSKIRREQSSCPKIPLSLCLQGVYRTKSLYIKYITGYGFKYESRIFINTIQCSLQGFSNLVFDILSALFSEKEATLRHLTSFVEQTTTKTWRTRWFSSFSDPKT